MGAMSLGADIGLVAADVLLELEELRGKLDLGLEEVLRVLVVGGRVAAVLLNVQADGGARGAGAGETHDDAAARGEAGVQALVRRDGAVEVGVGKVASGGDGALCEVGQLRFLVAFAVKRTTNLAANNVRLGDESLELTNDLVGALGVDVLVVVAGEKGTAILRPKVLLDLLDRRSGAGVLDTQGGNNVEPGDDSPQTVLLTDVVTASTEALLTADGQLLGVKESTEELPASGDLVAVETLSLGDKVDGARSGHRASEAVDAVLLEVRNELGVVGNDGQRVARRDEGVGAVNHVAVTIAVRGSTERNVVLVDNLNERMGVGQVGVGVAAVKVGAGNAVLCGAGEAKLLLEDGLAIGASDAVKTVKEDLEVGVRGKELLDGVKVENILEHRGIVGRAVNNLDLESAVGLGADSSNVDIGDGGELVGGQGLGRLKDLVRNGLGGGATVGKVVLDTEVVLGAYRYKCLVVSAPGHVGWNLPPGLWLAVRRIPPVALRRRMTWLAAGVDRIPF